MFFKDLNLHPDILKVLEEMGFDHPTPIQEQAIPLIATKTDVCACAQTGTGKTAAFILPALNRLANTPTGRGQGPRVLVLVPTRELAMQVAAETTKFSKYLPRLRTVCIYGGAHFAVQNKQLARPYEILVATPGRLIDQIDRGRINLSRVEMLVLDEADRMLDMGFIEPVEQIAKATPTNRQTLLFSATLKDSVHNLSKNLLKHPTIIRAAQEKVQHEHIEQLLLTVDNLNHKLRLLDHLLKDPTVVQAIVFTSTKHFTDQLAEKLVELGHQAGALHGDMSQRQRTRTMALLREGKIRILVATDVAARGIDILTISHVINFDLPNNVEDYVHRIGRTGRAGSSGIAFSFAEHKQAGLIKQIERFTGHRITPHVVTNMEPGPAPSIKKSRPYDRERKPPRGGGMMKRKFQRASY